MKTYIIKITDSTGMEHHHLVEDENDLQILKAVLNRVEKLATQKVNELSKGAVMPSCEGNCGMNYCDDNGCIERKRILVEPQDLPEHGA